MKRMTFIQHCFIPLFFILFIGTASAQAGYNFDYSLQGASCDNPTYLTEGEDWSVEIPVSYSADSGLPSMPPGAWYRLRVYFEDPMFIQTFGPVETNWIPWGNHTFTLDQDDIPDDLPSGGNFRVIVWVQYYSLLNTEIPVRTSLNGNLQCEDFFQDNGGPGGNYLSCSIGDADCIAYTACHRVQITCGSLGNDFVQANTIAGSGFFMYYWLAQKSSDVLPTLVTYGLNKTSIPKKCGYWRYQVIVQDIATGCSVSKEIWCNKFCSIDYQVDDKNRMAQEVKEIKLYPNPVSDMLQVEISGWGDENHIVMYDLSGKRILSSVMDASQTEIDVTSVPDGFYFIQILNTDGEMIHSEKIVVKH